MSKIAEGERAVRLKYAITGGAGSHDKGAVLRDLSESAFSTLALAGGHEVLEPGTTITDAKVGDADPAAPPAPTGNKTGK